MIKIFIIFIFIGIRIQLALQRMNVEIRKCQKEDNMVHFLAAIINLINFFYQKGLREVLPFDARFAKITIHSKESF